jgi:hypothetical protein
MAAEAVMGRIEDAVRVSLEPIHTVLGTAEQAGLGARVAQGERVDRAVKAEQLHIRMR